MAVPSHIRRETRLAVTEPIAPLSSSRFAGIEPLSPARKCQLSYTENADPHQHSSGRFAGLVFPSTEAASVPCEPRVESGPGGIWAKRPEIGQLTFSPQARNPDSGLPAGRPFANRAALSPAHAAH